MNKQNGVVMNRSEAMPRWFELSGVGVGPLAQHMCDLDMIIKLPDTFCYVAFHSDDRMDAQDLRDIAEFGSEFCRNFFIDVADVLSSDDDDDDAHGNS